MRPIVRVRNLSKRYSLLKPRGTRQTLRQAFVEALKAPVRRISRLGMPEGEALWALRDISFDVEPGEVVGVIGPNGAGKSTLLKILSRITKPSTGEIDLYGRVGSLLSVGAGFHPNLTGRENIYFHGSLLGMRRAEIRRKFDEIVAFAEVEQFLDTAVKHYSSGMYVRLAFAIAAHAEPEILLLDEVVAIGDDAFQKKCVLKLLEMPPKGHTVFFVSHNLAMIRDLCHRVLLIESGLLYLDADAASVIAKYLGSASQHRS
ncbi:MAG TPA: ABC transporter ATP-binding protein [Pyrinomonadaceae bacterium]|jgi:lipopolysaccharide transport system ATP-binding protein